MRSAAGPNHRQVSFIVKVIGPQPVGPNTGRVDDVVGLDLELTSALDVAHRDSSRAAVLLNKAGRFNAVGADRAEPLCLLERRQHEP